jgi:hypothetical protein
MTSALLLAFCLVAGKPADSTVAGLAFSYRAVLKVDDAEVALKSLVASAESLGGYFANQSRERLDLRIPSAQAAGFWKGLPGHGLLAEQYLESENLTTYLAELEGRISAKRKTLDQYFALLQTASDTTLFQIEATLSGLQREIDAAKGEQNMAEDRTAFARVDISFAFHDRTAPLPTGNTRFPWLNALGLQTLLERFGYGRPDAP